MSMINREISDFRSYAYHENDFKFVSKEDILGKWSVFFLSPLPKKKSPLLLKQRTKNSVVPPQFTPRKGAS